MTTETAAGARIQATVLHDVGRLFQRLGRARAAIGPNAGRVFRVPAETLAREAEAFRAKQAFTITTTED